jgi:hypothetical protein
MTSDAAMAAVSAQVVQLTPGILAMAKAGTGAGEQLEALTRAVTASFVALQVHLTHALEQGNGPTKWPGPISKPVRPARARQKAKGTNTASKAKRPQASHRGH